MENSDFERLLQRYLSGHASEEEKARLESWLDLDKTGHATGQGFGSEPEQRLIRVNGRLQQAAPEAGVQRHRPTWRWLAAACLIPGIAFALYWWAAGSRDQSQIEIVATADRQKVLLPDGSLVWLRKGSRLAYLGQGSPGIRSTEFQGEAVFEVAKNPDSPFVISCGDLKVRVLGTSFHLKASAGQLELSVLTGQVELVGAEHKLQVRAREKLVYAAGRGAVKNQLSEHEAATATAGLEYKLQFTNTGLHKVVEALASKYEVDIDLSDAELGACRITIDLTDLSLESALQMISEVLHVSVSRDDAKITLNGDGCR